MAEIRKGDHGWRRKVWNAWWDVGEPVLGLAAILFIVWTALTGG